MLYAGGRDAVRGPTFELGDNLLGAQRPSAGGAVRASSRPNLGRGPTGPTIVNAAANVHMLRISQRMGFRKVDDVTRWRLTG